MTLQEALKSGKPFRRPSFDAWYTSDGVTIRRDDTGAAASWTQGAHHLVADDWEIQEPTVTVTRTQLRTAIRDAYGVFHIGQERQLFAALGLVETD